MAETVEATAVDVRTLKYEALAQELEFCERKLKETEHELERRALAEKARVAKLEVQLAKIHLLEERIQQYEVTILEANKLKESAERELVATKGNFEYNLKAKVGAQEAIELEAFRQKLEEQRNQLLEKRDQMLA